ncbi:MAG: diguanylate cyclase/phosphodiesterase (GGDEF & EAL domains) with PAS/PAC sensor(s), partial [uncultured Solirubrobacteraceae bacterium]
GRPPLSGFPRMLVSGPPSPPSPPYRLGRLTLPIYLAVVGLGGTALLVALGLAADWSAVEIGLAHVTLAAFLVLGELMPIRVPGHEDEVNTSTSFSFALLLIVGLAPAAIAQAIASAAADVRLGKSLGSVLFNVGQYTISLAAAGVVLTLVAGDPLAAAALHPEDLPALLAAGATFFVVNNALAGAAYAIHARVPVVGHLFSDLSFQAWTATLVLGFSPVVIAVANYDAFLLPFLLLPLMAIYRAGREARLSEHQALHDQLTELPNRVLFRRCADEAIAAAAGGNTRVAVLIMDLNRFKEINDTLGHLHGDLLLQQVASRLRETVRVGDTVARLGGDEFAILLPRIGGIEGAELLAKRVLTALKQPVVINGVSLTVEASIGMACFPEHGDGVDVLVQRADVAMYVAKSARVGVQAYVEEQDDHSIERLELAAELRSAIDGGQMVLHYQPQLDLATGRLIAAEGLMRWDHPTRGLIPPDVFITLAENTGAIRQLTSRALVLAVSECRRWRQTGLSIGVSVNVSAQDALDEDLPHEIERLLARYDVPPSELELELTESMLMADPQRASSVLEALSAMGVRIAIDDFGTGYSSLAYLKRLPIDHIKIDRSFVMNMEIERNDALIVESTVDLARNLGLKTIAEGIENEECRARLAAMGCDVGQGFHFSRPVAPDAFLAWATDRVAAERLAA